MTEKLEITEKRFDEINEKLTDINVINDQEQYKSLMKELKNLTPIIEKYRMYKTARSDFEEAEQMLSDGGLDKDFKEIVQEQYETSLRTRVSRKSSPRSCAMLSPLPPCWPLPRGSMPMTALSGAAASGAPTAALTIRASP